MQSNSPDGAGAIEKYYAVRVVDGVEILDEPLPAGDPLLGVACPFCRSPFEVGDVLKLVNGGPASEEEERKLRAGLPHEMSPPLPLHLNCGNPKMTAGSDAGH